ncbi:MAG: DUF1697 domain-containing protein [Acidobacteria bacterium]|nr:DUF1697 domain-containing protein [Acidobacteriota bacterium]
MNTRYVALWRGINVGKAKRIAMSDLKQLIAANGFSEVVTVLNSGNALFTGSDQSTEVVAEKLQTWVAHHLDVTARVFVIKSDAFLKAMGENPLLDRADNPSRLLVSFMHENLDRSRIQELLEQSWSPEAVAMGSLAVYSWCPGGILDSALLAHLNRRLGDSATARNWGTVLKIAAKI